ncbi:MAG: hypothetical protein MJ211_06290 [Bacteroidales bacterium]|nr:hypothetical protein [Bacteroidales bacterium]
MTKKSKDCILLLLMLIVVVNVYVANQNIDVNNSILDLESLEAKGYELLETGTYFYDEHGNLIEKKGSNWKKIDYKENGYYDNNYKFHGTIYQKDICAEEPGSDHCKIGTKNEYFFVYP